MEKKYNVTGIDRKELVRIIGQTIKTKPVYMKVPTCAYTVGDITVDRDGTMIWDERTDDITIQKVIDALADAGYVDKGDAPDDQAVVAETTASDSPTEPDMEPLQLTVSLPISQHNGNSLRNLVNLIYTRAGLINKALGTSFAADQGLINTLAQDEGLQTAEDFRKVIAAYEGEHGQVLSGISITQEVITFSSLPETADPEKMKAFTELVAMMNKQAIDQKRIQAKAVNEENEKYALRIWLTRLGMNGPEYKVTRKILMENLSGHAAFRTEADKEKWMQRQAQKREAKGVTAE